jgi:inorganic pyrophosphatase
MTIKIFVEAETGSFEKRRYDEKTLEYQGIRRTILAYPFPYGFIMKTETEDGEGIDAYVITKDDLEAGQIFDAEPVGMLEVSEGDEIDNKVLACLSGQIVEIDDKLLEILENFIYGIWRDVPDVKIRVGKLLSKQDAIEYIGKHTIE